MDYIDWIIATIVFLVTVSLILVTVFNFIPVNKETNIVSENLYKNIIENIDVYNIKTTNTEVTPYMFYPKEKSGISQNISLIEDGKYYGVLKEKDKFFVFFENKSNNWNKPPTEITLEENQELLLDINEIETPVLWLDASTLNLNNEDLVEMWPDKSGNNNNAEIYSDSNAPVFKTNAINGKPALKFTGESNQKLKTPPLDLTDDKYSIITVFKNEKKTSTSGLWNFFDTLQGFIFVNGEGRWIGASTSSSFIYCNNSNRDEFIINSVIKSGGLNIADDDFELNMYINTKNETGTNPSPGNSFATSNGKNFRIGAWTSLVPPDIIFGGELSEIIVFNKILTDNERLFIENYLSQKYNILVNNGINFYDDNIKIYNKNTNELITTLYFVNENTNEPVSCGYSYKNKKISIESCDDEKAIIVSDYEFDNINFGSAPKESPLGILVLEERFDDFNYSKNLEITPEANINTGILILEADTIIKTKEKFYDYSGFLSTTDAVTVIFNEDINNTYFCDFSNYAIISGLFVDGTKYIINMEDYNKSSNWNKIEFKPDALNDLITCKIGNTVVNQPIYNMKLINSKIVIKTENDNTLIDDFYVYLNNDIVSNPVAKSIKGNYIDCNLSNNIANIKLIEEDQDLSLDFNFSKELVNFDKTGVTIVKTNDEENKMGFFPQTKEFWIFKDKDENIEITLPNNLKLYEMNFEDMEKIIWFDTSKFDQTHYPEGEPIHTWADFYNNYEAKQTISEYQPIIKRNALNGNHLFNFQDQKYMIFDTLPYVFKEKDAVVSFFLINKIENNQKNTLFDFTSNGTNSKITAYFDEDNRFVTGSRSTNTEELQEVKTIETYSTNEYRLFTIIHDLKKNTIDVWVNGIKKETTGTINFENNVYDNSFGDIHTLGTDATITNFLEGDIAFFIVFDFIINNYSKIYLENFLLNKFGLDLENSIPYNESYLDIVDSSFETKKIRFEFLDKKTEKPINCKFLSDVDNKKINITDCEEDVIIKVRYDLAGVDDFLPRNKINITKTKEEIITEDKFIKITEETVEKKNNEERIYYLRLFNKVTNLENTENIYSAKPYTNFTKLLWNTGLLEEIKVEIKN